MIYIAALVTIRRNFRKHYALANGLTLAGVSVAIFVFPPVIRVLINYFGWRGALSILSAFSLHSVVTGSLMKLPRARDKEKRDSNFTSKDIKLNSSDFESRENMTYRVCNTFQGDEHCKESPTTLDAADDRYLNIDSHKTDVHIYSSKSNQTAESNGVPSNSVVSTRESLLANTPSSGEKTYKRSVFKEKYGQFLRRTITNALFAVVVGLWSMSNTAMMKFLVAAGVQKGLSSIEGAVLLSVTGATQCISLFSNGAIISHGWLTPVQLYLIAIILMTVSEFGIAFFHHYIMGLVASAVFGLGTGAVVSLNLVVQRTLDDRAGVLAAGGLVFVEGLGGCVGGLCIGKFEGCSAWLYLVIPKIRSF